MYHWYDLGRFDQPKWASKGRKEEWKARYLKIGDSPLKWRPSFFLGENDDQPLDLSWATVPAASLFLPTHSWKRAMFQKGQLLRG